jgi:nicotinic acid phosphoribosyltransferase
VTDPARADGEPQPSTPRRSVIRPDSGDPARTVLEVMSILGERFGGSVNGKGYRVLPPQVRVIRGDAIDYDKAGRVLAALAEHGWSADNIAFGMGGALRSAPRWWSTASLATSTRRRPATRTRRASAAVSSSSAAAGS